MPAPGAVTGRATGWRRNRAVDEIRERVRYLIRRSGLSEGAFARAAGLDGSKLTEALGGTRRFSSLELALIADAHHVTVDWILTGEEPAVGAAARTATGQERAALDAASLYTVTRNDLAALGWEHPWRPPAAGHVHGAAAEQGEQLAAAACKALRDSSARLLPDAVSAVEQVFGADIAVLPLGGRFDGLAASAGHAKVIILGTAQDPARQRFALAHELGRLLAAGDQEVRLDPDLCDDAQAEDPGWQRAAAFANAFLMPPDVLRSAAGASALDEDGFARLAWSLRVPPASLAARLRELRLIGPGACGRFRQITAARAAFLAGRSEEFARQAAEAGAPRLPRLLALDTYAAYESGAITLRPYAALLGTSTGGLRRITEPGSEAAGP